jgi:hypothetical protein
MSGRPETLAPRSVEDGVALLQVVTIGEVGIRRHPNMVEQRALLLGLVAGAFAAFGGTLAWIDRDVPPWSSTPDGIVRVLDSPLVRLTLPVVSFVLERDRRPCRVEFGEHRMDDAGEVHGASGDVGLHRGNRLPCSRLSLP